MSKSLLSKLTKTNTLKGSALFNQSEIMNGTTYPTDLYVLNIAFSGSIFGGLTPGLTQIAGPSKHFKSLLMLLMAKSFLDKEPDGILMFYDNEFGASQDYFDMIGIDTSRVLHLPFTSIEDFKFDVVKKLQALERSDKVMIAVDSIGNAASKKEIDDAQDEKSVADMTRAKSIKSVWRIVTPHLIAKDIPCVAINHTYVSQTFIPQTIVSGGCVVEGTKIKTPTGLKAVENFEIGDKVLTLNGENEVTHVWDPTTLEEGNPECFEIEFEDGYKVICSDKHKFLIDGTWVEAKDLVEGMDCEVL